MDRRLNLAEELLLLGLHDEKGTVLMAASLGLTYGLAGALLVELAQAGHVRIEGKDLVAAPRGFARDAILDEILAAVRSSPKTRRIDHWVARFGRSGSIKKKLLARLVEKGVLVRQEGRLLWVFPTSRYPQLDPRPESKIRDDVRSALRGVAAPEGRIAALIGLIHACDLVGVLFEKGERREARKRAKEISRDQPIGSAVARAVEAVRTAVVIAAS
jgi:Golgi phosphoprotein 3